MRITEPVLAIHELRKLGPSEARYWLDEYRYDRQRPLRAARVEALARMLRAGRFMPATLLVLARIGGLLRLLDGQHRLHAVVRAGQPASFVVVVYDCDDWNAAAALYSRFDQHGKRTLLDAMGAFGLLAEGKSPQRFLTAFGAATGVRLGDFRLLTGQAGARYQAAHETRIEAMAEYGREAELYKLALEDAPRGFRPLYLRKEVMAVALETIKYQAARASAFWERSAKNDGLRAGDPAKALLEFLRLPYRGKARGKAYRNAAAICWNAAFKKRDLRLVRPDSLKTFRLEGTPWDGESAAPVLACQHPEWDIAPDGAPDGAGEPLAGQRVLGNGAIRAVLAARRVDARP